MPITTNAIQSTDEGFTIPGERFVFWSEVDAITAFKRDLLTTDLVCLRFDVSRPDHNSVEMNEEMPGFDEAAQMLASIFPDAKTNWREQVVLPAFVTNPILIFKKKSGK